MSPLNRPAHREKLPRRIDKIPRPRPNQHVNRNPQPFSRRLHQSEARSNPATIQIAAKFNPIRAAALSGHRKLHRSHADLKHHRTVPISLVQLKLAQRRLGQSDFHPVCTCYQRSRTPPSLRANEESSRPIHGFVIPPPQKNPQASNNREAQGAFLHQSHLLAGVELEREYVRLPVISAVRVLLRIPERAIVTWDRRSSNCNRPNDSRYPAPSCL